MERTDWILGSIAAIMLAMLIAYSIFLIRMVDQSRETREAIINAIYKTDSLELQQRDRCFYLRICLRPHLDAAGETYRP